MKKSTSSRWTRYRRPKKPEHRDGRFLVHLRSGRIMFGSFYCGEFVEASRGYNETPGLLPHITHILKVEAP